MNHKSSSFKWRHYEAEVILLCVRWYRRYQQLIDLTLDRVVREYDLFYTQLWNSLNSTQQRVLLAVISEGGTGLQFKKESKTIGRTPAIEKKGTAIPGSADTRSGWPMGA